ncbi:MAG: hypothetical protein KKG59_04295 [Nanoarchaeota archaeon]|nr:hypothetical protein [Nanoarchaeota archaeon]
MKAKLIILSAFIVLSLFLMETKDASAYTYGYNYQRPAAYYNYQAGSNYGNYQNDYPVYNGGSKYFSRYRGGIYPAYYQMPRPYGYQGGTFNSGSGYYKVYKPASSQVYYGAGRSDYYYDGGYMRQSRYVMY